MTKGQQWYREYLRSPHWLRALLAFKFTKFVEYAEDVTKEARQMALGPTA